MIIKRIKYLKRFRKNGYANIILKYLEEDAMKLGYKKIIMNSALSAVGFYEKNNYKALSDVFCEDNRPPCKNGKSFKIKELIQMNENKTNINWLSMIYLTHLENTYKIREN